MWQIDAPGNLRRYSAGLLGITTSGMGWRCFFAVIA
jgi:hypothetical protein